MEIEVLDLSQKPICLNENDLPTAMDLSRKVNSQSSGVICLSEDEDDDNINQLLNKLNIENPSLKTIEACHLLLHQLDERLRNEETIEILLAQMKHTQKKIPPSTSPANANTSGSGNIRQNGHVAQPIINNNNNSINNNNNSISQNSNRPNNEMSIENSPNNQSDALTAAGTGTGTSIGTAGNRTSAHGASNNNNNNTNTAAAGGGGAPYTNDASKSSTNGPRMTREMAMQALDQQYLARKALLRKQADKALSEVPLARPPQGAMAQSDLNLIPSTATNEFVALVGLEEVVKNLQEYRNLALGHNTNEVRMVFTPFNCVQCGTDFTPLWKRERPGSSKVVCESCCGENYRRALQNDYQDKIRLVLKKYQDQERDLDRDYKDMLDSPKKFELFRKEQEKKLLAMSATNNRPSTATTQPGSRTSTGHHHQTPTSTVTATQSQGRPSHRPSNTVSAVSGTGSRTAPTTVSQQYGQQMRHQSTAASGITAPSTAPSQLTVDQLAYMQMFQALNQLGSSSNLNQQATRQQQQLMQQILQMAYMSSASTLLGGSTNNAAANSFVQFLSNMAGLLNNPSTTPDTTSASANSTSNNALLNYYLSMLQQQQATANSDK